MAIAIHQRGTFSLTAVGPGVVATTSVACTGMTATENETVTIGRVTNPTDAQGSFDVYITPGADAFTITCCREQLNGTLTFNYMVGTGS